MEIRFAKKEDVPGLIVLARALAAQHHQFDGYYRAGENYDDDELTKIFESDLKDRNTTVIVAEEHGEVIGFVKGLVEEAPTYMIPQIKKIGKIGITFVSERHRKKGVAKLLMNKLEDWFKRKKIVRSELHVDVRNSDAIAAWKKMGFENYQLRMAKNLDD